MLGGGGGGGAGGGLKILKSHVSTVSLLESREYLCQQVFRKHTDSSHSNGIDKTY